MSVLTMLFRPDRLEIGAAYLLRESGALDPLPGHINVILVGYDNCPAFVYVRNAQGYVGRCCRSDLFLRATRTGFLP
jgi:hypothetical protein